jgi:flagellar basal body-associated protein FliL
MADKASENEKEESKKPAGSMLPMIIMLVAMPLTAWLTTTILIIPQMQQKLNPTEAGESSDKESVSAESGEDKKGSEGKDGKAAEENVLSVNKVRVNVKNTNGSRFLYVSYLMKGKDTKFKTVMESEEKKAMIRDTALGILMSFDIVDLGQRETKDRAATQMVTAFNDALRGDFIEEIFFTEWTVQ